MPTIGAGVVEIRLRDEAGIFRVFYVAKFVEAVYVLHCFQKKTQKTDPRDVELGRRRVKQLLEERGS
jgi:phage-related protein